MPRKLPWIVKVEPKREDGEDNASRNVGLSHITAGTTNHKRTKADPELDDDDAQDVESANKKKRSDAPFMYEPPGEDFMTQGFQGDDAWRMVEDEFFSTARLFTAHLHAAEYKRLKKMAQENGRDQFFKPANDLVVDTALSARSITRRGKGKQPVTQGDLVQLDPDDDPFMKDITLAAMMRGDHSQSARGLLITRKTAVDKPQQEVEHATRSGWVGTGTRDVPVEDDEMDLDDVPHSPNRQHIPNRTVKSSLPGDPPPNTASEPQMWIGAGRSAPAAMRPPPAVSMRRDGHSESSKALKTDQASVPPTDMWIASSQLSNNSHEPSLPIPDQNASYALQESSMARASTNEEIVDFKRTALNPKVLARLARRKQQQSVAETEASTKDESNKETEIVIPTFAY